MNSTIETIKSRLRIVDIAQLLGLDVHLEGRHPTADCPFCDDQKQHLYLYPDTNTFYCFKCRKSGDLINLWASVKGISLKDAIKALAPQDCIVSATRVHNAPTSSAKQQPRKNQQLALSDTDLSRIYMEVHNLTGLTARGREYLGKRGLSDVIIKRYSICSIDDPMAFKSRLLKAFSENELLAAGLLDYSAKGNLYCSFFRPAILFFHFDLECQQITYISTRNLEGEVKCFKLHNVPSRLYFGQDVKESQIVYVFEGIITALSCGELLGRDNFIALGGLITPKVFQALRERFPDKKIVLGLDPDVAGEQALAAIPLHSCVDWPELSKKLGKNGVIPVNSEGKSWDMNDWLVFKCATEVRSQVD